MRVIIFAQQTRGAMGQYLEALSSSLISTDIQIKVVTPIVLSDLIQPSSWRIASQQLNPFSLWRTWQEIRDFQPDLIHLFNAEGYPWSVMIARLARWHNIPVLVTLHDPEPHPGNAWDWLNARLRFLTLKLAAAIHIHSEQFKPLLNRSGYKASVFVIPHGSLAGRYLKWRNQDIKREKLALFFGRLEAYKGIDLLVESGLSPTWPEQIKIIIAGPGKLPQNIRRDILSRPNRFKLIDKFLSDSEVAGLFQRAMVCILPYRQATQSSLPMIAAAFGVPVIASMVGAFVVDVPQVNGILIPPDNSKALIQAVTDLMNYPVASRYPKELDFSALSYQFIETYNQIIEQSR